MTRLQSSEALSTFDNPALSTTYTFYYLKRTELYGTVTCNLAYSPNDAVRILHFQLGLCSVTAGRCEIIIAD